MVLAVMLPALALVTRHVLPGRVGSIILAALLAHVGWHWMMERWETLATARWPSLDMANLPLLLFWVAGLALAAGGVVAIVARLRLEPASPARGARETAAVSRQAD